MLSLIPRASIFALSQPIFPTRWQWLKLKVRLWLARAACERYGHFFTRRAWQHRETLEVAEHHCGCTRCDIYWEETPDFVSKTKPRFMFAGRRPTRNQLGEPTHAQRTP